MITYHLNAGARGRLLLVEDDAERWDLLARLAGAFGPRLLAFAILATHVHAVVEGRDGPQRLETALAGFVRFGRRRRGSEGLLLRGPVHATPKTDAFELARTIAYVHRNALDVPHIERTIEYPWTSERAFLGLREASAANVSRALVLLNPHAGVVIGARRPLADLARPPCPELPPSVLAAAAADHYELPPAALADARRDQRSVQARGLYLGLGTLEGYTIGQLAAMIGRSRSQASRILASAPPEEAILRAARAIARDPGIARRLPAAAPMPPAVAHASATARASCIRAGDTPRRGPGCTEYVRRSGGVCPTSPRA